MSNLMLTRTAGQSVRLNLGDKTEYVEVLEVTGGYCKFRLLSTLRTERVKFRGTLAVAEGVEVTVIDLARGHAKLQFSAPKDVHILRTELIKGEGQ